jgi:ADP-heptose:LPS heptosyltransferase
MKRFFRYLSLWHLKSLFTLIYVDLFRMHFVRRPQTNAVVVLKLDRLGDYILCRNFLRLFRTYPPFQSRKIFLCASINLRELIETYDADVFDGFIWIDPDKLINEAGYRFALLRQIKQLGAEIAIHPTYAREFYIGDCLMAATSAPQRIGREPYDSPEAAARHSKPLVNKLGDLSYNRLATEDHGVIFDFYRYRTFFSQLLPGAEMPRNTRLTPIPVPLPEFSGPFAIIMPGANEAYREWPADRFAQVARHLFETHGWRVFVLGTKADVAKARTIRQAAPANAVEDFCGQLTLPQIVYLMSRCALGVTNDSGGIHLLAALNKPGVAVSNCNTFGLFHPYPREISDSVSFVYPPAFYALPLSMPDRRVMYGRGKHFPITEVTVESVIERIEAVLRPPFQDPIEILNG